MKITFVLKDGSEKVVDFSAGETILQIAEKNEILLRHNCEGFGVCGSCHVIIEEGEFQPISDREKNTLDLAANVTPNSRLACQAKPSGDAKVRIP